ncbi:unnamed protein product, partial [Sphacelaria rigidula]
RYAWEALAKVVFEGQTYSGIDDCTVCYGVTGEEVLDSLSSNGGTDIANVSVAAWCGVLIGLALFWRVVHYSVLRRSIL